MSAATFTTKKIAHNATKITRKEKRVRKEVDTLRERTKPILPATTFKRIVIQEAAKFSGDSLRFNRDAVIALQTAAEEHLTNIFSGAAFCAEIGKRDTVTIEDMRNFQAIRKL